MIPYRNWTKFLYLLTFMNATEIYNNYDNDMEPFGSPLRMYNMAIFFLFISNNSTEMYQGRYGIVSLIMQDKNDVPSPILFSKINKRKVAE